MRRRGLWTDSPLALSVCRRLSQYSPLVVDNYVAEFLSLALCISSSLIHNVFFSSLQIEGGPAFLFD
jgi:hypothetical protein